MKRDQKLLQIKISPFVAKARKATPEDDFTPDGFDDRAIATTYKRWEALSAYVQHHTDGGSA